MHVHTYIISTGRDFSNSCVIFGMGNVFSFVNLSMYRPNNVTFGKTIKYFSNRFSIDTSK